MFALNQVGLSFAISNFKVDSLNIDDSLFLTTEIEEYLITEDSENITAEG